MTKCVSNNENSDSKNEKKLTVYYHCGSDAIWKIEEHLKVHGFDVSCYKCFRRTNFNMTMYKNKL